MVASEIGESGLKGKVNFIQHLEWLCPLADNPLGIIHLQSGLVLALRAYLMHMNARPKGQQDSFCFLIEEVCVYFPCAKQHCPDFKLKISFKKFFRTHVFILTYLMYFSYLPVKM